MRGFVVAVALLAVACLFAPSEAQAQCGIGGQQFAVNAFGQPVVVNGFGFQPAFVHPQFQAQGFVGVATAPTFVNPFVIQANGFHVNRFGNVQVRQVQRQGLFGRRVVTTTTRF